MLNGTAKVSLTLTAVAPVGLVYAFASFQQKEYLVSIISLAVSLVCLLVCLFVISFAKKNLEGFDFSSQTIEAADGENLGFTILYVLPLFTDKIANMNWAAWIPILVVSSMIIGTGYGYHFNPPLGLLRWHFYKVTSGKGVTYVLITRKTLTAASSKLRVGLLTEYVLLDLGKNK